MNRVIEHELNGFTILFDGITAELGLVTSAVFGQVWRHCQMRDGFCWASQSTLGESLGLSRATILKHLQTLVDAGYLRVEQVEGEPNNYYDTGRITLKTITFADTNPPYNSGGCQSNLQGVSTKFTGGVNLVDTSNTSNNTITNTKGDSQSSGLTSLSGTATSGFQEGGEVVYTNSKPKPVKQPKKYALSTDEVVTDIIRNSDKAKTAVSSDIPEIYIPYAKAFMDGTGLKYVKRFFGDWVSTFSDWISLGYSPADVRDAIDAIIDEGKSDYISRPGSINWKLQSMSVRKPKERVYKDVTGMEDE